MGAWTKEGMEEVGEGQAREWDEGGTKPDTKKRAIAGPLQDASGESRNPSSPQKIPLSLCSGG